MLSDTPTTSLGRIRAVRLGYEDHGILTSMVDLEYAEEGRKIGGTGQGFGGWGFGGGFGEFWIRGMLDVCGVQEWAQCVGAYVYVSHEHTRVHSITGVNTGVTFDPSTWRDPSEEQDEAPEPDDGA